MIKVSVLYPNTAGCKFDMEYYLTRHMPMVQQKLGPACKRMAVEEGIAGGAPGTPATYIAMGHLYFDSTDTFQTAFAPHAQSILADIPNYTDTQPTIQISEVRLFRNQTSNIRHDGRAILGASYAAIGGEMEQMLGVDRVGTYDDRP